MKKILFLLTGFIIYINATAQEQLPNFSAYKVGNGRVVIAWTHNYPAVKQISIQRSTDSLNFFKTITTMPDPNLQQNGFADVNALDGNMFYRIFVMFEGGNYMATKSKRPTIDSSGLADAYNSGNKANMEKNPTATFIPSGDIQSIYVFSSPDRYVRVELPNDKRKYDIRFYNESGQPLFELDNVKEKKFKLDRSYFSTAGYIHFELYADGKLLEKNKLYLPKDF